MSKRVVFLCILLMGVGLFGGLPTLYSQDLALQKGKELRKTFLQNIKNELPKGDFLLKGKHYQYVYPRVQGSYILRGIPKTGKILFDGLSFSDLTLSYDLYNDLVFSTQIQKEGNRNIILSSHKLDEFWIDQRQFIRMDILSDSISLAPGFYQLAYERGEKRILVKWKMKINKYASSVASSKSGQKPYKFIPVHEHFMHLGDTAHLIKKKKDILEVVENPLEVKAFMKQQNIKLKSPDPDIISGELIQLLNFLSSPLERG